MSDTEELNGFLTDLNQEVRALVEIEKEEGALLEEKATEYLIGLLADAGETENARVCTSIKANKAHQIQHKINGYALSEDFETVDLFITFFQETTEARSFVKTDVTTAANQSERFLKNVFNGYRDEIDESAPAYELAQVLFDNAGKVVRARIFILTNARLTSDAALPDRRLNQTVQVQYHIWDLDRFHRLWTSRNRREPIEIEFERSHGQPLNCLPMPVSNNDYQSYLAIVPGTLLAEMYERYGARLLEQNVRSFLDFTGAVNKGIRNTIKTAPHRFLAYNNGIAATAEQVDVRQLPGGGWGIHSVRDLQIVNGGQTTAAIFRTQRQDRADISSVFVQMKLTVLRRPEDMDEIIPLISQYANSQNGIQAADLSANNKFNRQLEKISRACWAPPAPNTTVQTRWFFERARGQYKVALNRELTPKRRKAFEHQNPRKQLFTKEMVAKFEHTWGGLPWLVARGAQKNYAEYLKKLGKDYQPNSIFFEDLIAKAILFRAADQEYGRGATKLGDYKFLTVPYTLAWLNHVTAGRIDLYKIWKEQDVSEALRSVINSTLRFVDNYLQQSAGTKLVSERAKQEDCWLLLRDASVPKDKLQQLLTKLQGDFSDPQQQQKRYRQTNDDLAAEERRQQEEMLRALGAEAWEIIEQWGRQSNLLSQHKRDRCNSIGRNITRNRHLTDSEVETGQFIIDLLLEHNPGLLDQLQEQEQPAAAPAGKEVQVNLTQELVAKLFDWEKKNKALALRDVEFLKTTMREKFPVGKFKAVRLHQIVEKAARYGFTVSA
ncbi:AIPR family protein [Hymenobacter wooponensis]|uniref:Abortive phage infection protein n=1 Tax=Hymenobacter wooponensis TaxID=1525360 RepID=A0A4Z0MQ91_9BACT|nr:AIPR family protein [Hymenobacter wooponensis]TGD81694.1 abortive phage infection protein [Hymenobacter wooponensis]